MHLIDPSTVHEPGLLSKSFNCAVFLLFGSESIINTCSVLFVVEPRSKN
jgi:hypothetical protein